jgi:hypothetical protein
MSDVTSGAGGSADRQRALIEGLSEHGLLPLDVDLRTIVRQAVRAPGIDGQGLLDTLERLHDQGVVNLDVSVRSTVESVNLERARRLQADVLCNDNYCLVVKSELGERPR